MVSEEKIRFAYGLTTTRTLFAKFSVVCVRYRNKYRRRNPFRVGLVGVNMGTLSMPIDEAAETPKCSPGTSNIVSPFDISPVPNIKKRTTTRGRKATRSTSSLDHHTRISWNVS
ncbi:hypothetical protein AVEN_132414-1 [Araneus ventricosus]|uniref:Uncharacterized protein n=1 Tax=Araneus ventricosus TaxID=182803 RepID=A0A4Y2LRF6_ARAVE|nr:hypothetical protein AVEN_132414-1 [Araneus ventricosus]